MNVKIKIVYNKFNVNITYNVGSDEFFRNVKNIDVLRYLKGIFTNKERFESRFINEFRKVPSVDKDFAPCVKMCDEFMENYDKVKPYTYEEAFKLTNQEFQIVVFGSIDISEMINTLGHERIATEGKQVKHKKFNTNGELIGMEEYDNIYEVHRVNGDKLGLEDYLYALKCWCTSTNDEHWLWIEDEYKDSPLEAVASTFRIHANLIPNIKEIKRQGDVLIVEMKEDVKPEGEIVPLNAEQYFNLLTCQT